MPIIPLLRTSPVAAVPGATLDRNRRPTLDTSGVAQAAGQLVNASKLPELPNSLAAPYEALGSVGRAIAQTGSVMGALAEKRLEAETDIQVAEADNSINATVSEFGVWRTEHPDPSEWEKEIRTRLSKTQETILANKKLHPAAREQINLRLTRAVSQAQFGVAEAAAVETFNLAKSTFLATVDEATEAQDKERFESALSTAEKKGYIYPHVSQNKRQSFKEVGERKKREAESLALTESAEVAVVLGVTEGEQEGLKALDRLVVDKKHSAIETEKLRNMLKGAASGRRSEEQDKLVDQILNDEIKFPEDIEARKGPHYTLEVKRAAKEYLAKRDAEKEREDREENAEKNYVELSPRVLNYDPEKDLTGLDHFHLRREVRTRVGKEDAGWLMTQLWARAHRKEPEPSSEVVGFMNERLKELFHPRTGEFGSWEERVKEKGKMVWKENPAKKSVAREAEFRVKKAMNDWVKTHPKEAQDFDAAKGKLREFLPFGTEGRVLDNMQKAIPRRASVPTALLPDLPARDGNDGLEDELGLPPLGFVPARK